MGLIKKFFLLECLLIFNALQPLKSNAYMKPPLTTSAVKPCCIHYHSPLIVTYITIKTSISSSDDSFRSSVLRTIENVLIDRTILGCYIFITTIRNLLIYWRISEPWMCSTTIRHLSIQRWD